MQTSLNRATSIADVAFAAGESISDLLIQLKEKVVAAADPGGSPASRTAYNNDFQALLKSVQSFVDNATFDGGNILNGFDDDGVTATTAPLKFLANADATEVITLSSGPFAESGARSASRAASAEPPV